MGVTILGISKPSYTIFITNKEMARELIKEN